MYAATAQRTKARAHPASPTRARSVGSRSQVARVHAGVVGGIGTMSSYRRYDPALPKPKPFADKPYARAISRKCFVRAVHA